MKRLTLSLSFFISLLLLSANVKAQTRLLFDDGWKFVRNGKAANVDLPHDWDIYHAPDPKTGTAGTGGGWYPAGKGEYRKKFSLESLKLKDGDLVKLHFEGVYQKAEVIVNGHEAGHHAYGYTPFTVDITPYVNRGKKQSNEVVVRVDNSEQPNCRWYSGSGIYRHVWLQAMPAMHIEENGVFVTTPDVSADKATVKVEVTVVNEAEAGKLPTGATVRVEGQEQSVCLNPGESKTLTFTYTIAKPKLWSPDSPTLYNASVTFIPQAGSSSITHNVKFGVRTFSFDAERGFVLNGRQMLINGANVHSDNGVLGAMAFDAAEVRKVRLMKEAGFNLLRTSHNPPSRAFIEACDSMGMLVIDEAFDGWRKPKNKYDYSTLIDSCGREDVQALVLRDRNSPSVICWSIGNEVIERTELQVVKTAKWLKKAVNDAEPTRPVTEALCCWGGQDWESFDPHADVLDVVGYNYMMHRHESDHERSPERVMWQTESYPRDAFANWKRTNDHPYIVGDIVWTGLDYLGESGIGRYYYKGKEPDGEHYRRGGQPQWHGAYCGDVDVTGWRKPISHYREMLWNDTNGLYMAVKEPSGYNGEIKETLWSVWPTWESWNWGGSTDATGTAVPSWEGKPIEVEVYTKSPVVSLYLNDRLVGKKEVGLSTEYKAVFSVPYEAGTLKAVDGSGNATTLVTAGEPAALRLTADKAAIAAGGQDLSFIMVEVVDSKGTVCPEAAVPLTVTVTGQGTLLAAASANMKDAEPATSPRVTTWKGRALIVVRSGKKRGKVNVAVNSALPAQGMRLETK